MKELTSALARPDSVATLGDERLNSLLSQARRAGVVARLDACLTDAAVREQLSPVVRDVLEGSRVYVEFLRRRLAFELRALARATASLPFPVVLLKGAAYFASGSPAARGRGVRDIDILVAKDHLGTLEATLRQRGWRPKDSLSTYDDHYYRDLSHELPPMHHPDFHFELDVHHDVLPPVHRLAIDIDAFLAATRPLEGLPFHVPSEVDQLIHSAVHLTLAEELQQGIRDLHDISLLLADLEQQGVTVDAIKSRAGVLGAQAATADALAAATRHFAPRPLPAGGTEDAAPGLRRQLVAWAIDQAVFGAAPSRGAQRRVAELVIWCRGQYLRMPTRVLLTHALHKWRQRLASPAATSRGDF